MDWIALASYTYRGRAAEKYWKRAVPSLDNGGVLPIRLAPTEGTPMHSFLQRFAGIVLGILSGFDRLVFRGRLRRLYQPEGMNHSCNANHVLRNEFKDHARSVTAQVMQASLVAEAKRYGRYRFLNSSQTDKDKIGRAIADQQRLNEGLVCVLQALETCWTFDVNSVQGVLKVQG